MFLSHWPKRRTWFVAALIAVVAVGAGGAFFMFTGFYNVGADVRHFRITEYLIRLTLHRSVSSHVERDEPPDLEEPGLTELGARYFDVGCSPCHGVPGEEANPVALNMYPAPPPLNEALLEWDVNEQHWIVQHGLKFTGMPAWAGRDRQREVWALVSFLQDVPGMTRKDYASILGREVDEDGPETGSVEFCSGCHGDADDSPINGLAPSLNGQNYAYLVRALFEYASNQRQSGMMEPIAAELDDSDIRRLAREYSSFDLLQSAEEHDPSEIQQGRQIVREGYPGRGIAPCSACHGAQSSSQFPKLNGLSKTYLVEQLLLWADGQRSQSGYGKIMQRAAAGLSVEEINAVAAYYAAQSGSRASNSSTRPAEQLEAVQ
ncbi:c-type cytochrome [Nitratireductor basaltis]|uniref:Cytochrome c, class I n=1 Tax=Nitratireductor basaltis TaxID=472175 RepID=A0A084UB01_9HYPH|nr:c-type cytochrome [Nitratireductor basaltis]KFB10137.1 Cytochrome c, class I precursor [Nitratireductor basaltis]